MSHKADLAIVHIGGPHAGSTRVQMALSKGRAPLSASRVLYPKSLGRTAHLKLVVAMMPLWRMNGPRRQMALRSYGSLRAHRRAVADDFAKEVNASRPRVIMISAEHLLNDASPRRLRRFLSPFAHDIQIVAWVRKQEEALMSSWLNGVKLGAEREMCLRRKWRDPMDYAARLRPWGRVFGCAALSVMPYDRSTDHVAHLLDRATVAWRPAHSNANASLGGAPLQFMQMLNRHLPRYKDGDRYQVNPLRGDLDAAIEEAPISAPPPRLNEDDADRIRARYATCNARLSQWFGDGAAFFPDGAGAGAGDEPEPLTVEDAVALAAHLWAYKQAQLNGLRPRSDQGATHVPRQSPSCQSKTARRWPLWAKSSQSNRRTVITTAQKFSNSGSLPASLLRGSGIAPSKSASVGLDRGVPGERGAP